MRKALGVLATLAAVMWASPAWADNTICANALPLIVGSTDTDTLPSSGNIYFKTRLTANRSYIFWVYAPFTDASIGSPSVDVALFSDIGCTTAALNTSTTEREPLDNITGADVDQMAIKPATSGTYVFRVNNNIALTYAVQVVVIETTLFSPWWFVGGNNQAFITLRNNMDATTIATVRIYASNGTICQNVDLSIPANGTNFLRVNDYAACVTSGFGSAAIAFHGPPAGFAANTTVIDAVAGVSFDEPFTPRMVWSIVPR